MKKEFIQSNLNNRLLNALLIFTVVVILFSSQAFAQTPRYKPYSPEEIMALTSQNNPKPVLGEYVNPYRNSIFPDGVGVYEGPSRFSQKLFKGDHLSKLSYAEDEITYVLTESESGRIDIYTDSSNEKLYWPKLNCTYRPPTDKRAFRIATFWFKARPEMSLNGDRLREDNFKYIVNSSGINDVAVERCPATWGEAMTVIWGPNAWSEKQELYANAREKSKQQEVEYMHTQKATFETKIKTNATPTAGDTITVAIENSMKKTYDETKFKSQNNGESYWIYKDFNGDRIYAAEIFINIRNLSCNKQKGKHVCNYDEVSQSSPIVNGKPMTMISPIESHNRTTTFYWTQSGLKTDNIKVVYLEKAVESQKKGYVNSIECGRWNELHPYDKKNCFHTIVPMPREDFEKL